MVGPPLRYEALMDDVAADKELLKVRDLRDKTRSLVQNLWDAARDYEAVEDLLEPVKQWPLDLLNDEKYLSKNVIIAHQGETCQCSAAFKRPEFWNIHRELP